MDRWGLSEDCPECGQACSLTDFRECSDCGDQICYRCLDNHKCTKCENCRHEVNKLCGSYDEDYGWFCCTECLVEFLKGILTEREKTSELQKKAATTGNRKDLHDYLEERRQAI